MADFDPEAYLEAKLDKKTASPLAIGNGHSAGDKESDGTNLKKGDDAERRSRSGSPHRRRGTRSPSLDRKRSRSRSPSRDRRSRSRRSRSGSRERRRRRSRSSSRERSRGSRRRRSVSKSRSRSRSRSPRRDRDRRSYRDDRYRGGRDRDRYRGGDRRDRYGGGYRGGYRRGSDRPPRDSDRDRERRDGDRPKSPEKTKEQREMEAYERSLRSVLVVNLSRKVVDRDVEEFFEKVGKVNNARLITDRHTGKSKGIAYVEFAEKASVAQALLLSGTPLKGQIVMVQASQAEKNFVAEKESNQGPTRLFVGGLHIGITESDLSSMFSEFGAIEFVNIYDPHPGKDKKYGFVQFTNGETAKAAVKAMDGFDVAGCPIKVQLVSGQSKTGGPDMMGMGPEAGQHSLDDDEGGGGVMLNAASRAALMQKLGRGTAGNVPMVASNMMMPGANAGPMMDLSAPTLPVSSVSSCCMVVKNMFDFGEKDSELFQDVEEDVKEECDKHGRVLHIHVDRNSPGYVYVKFDNPESARKSMAALNGRWYAGKMISCQFIQETAYRARFSV